VCVADWPGSHTSLPSLRLTLLGAARRRDAPRRFRPFLEDASLDARSAIVGVSCWTNGSEPSRYSVEVLRKRARRSEHVCSTASYFPGNK